MAFGWLGPRVRSPMWQLRLRASCGEVDVVGIDAEVVHARQYVRDGRGQVITDWLAAGSETTGQYDQRTYDRRTSLRCAMVGSPMCNDRLRLAYARDKPDDVFLPDATAVLRVHQAARHRPRTSSMRHQGVEMMVTAPVLPSTSISAPSGMLLVAWVTDTTQGRPSSRQTMIA